MYFLVSFHFCFGVVEMCQAHLCASWDVLSSSQVGKLKICLISSRRHRFLPACLSACPWFT